MSAVFAAKLAGIKNIVYVVNNIAFPYVSLSRLIDYPLDRIVANAVTIFITGSFYASRQLKKVLRLRENQVYSIWNGILPRQITEEREDVLKRLCIPPPAGRLLIGVVAILEKRKGHLFLLKAIKLLKEKRIIPVLPLLLIEGRGIEMEKLRKFVAESDLASDVFFVGSESNVFNFINAVDFIVLPSVKNEDFPNIILEAMSLSKTVIASRLAGITEQIEHMKTGILVEPCDINGLAESIALLIKNKNLLSDFGCQARLKFLENFTNIRAAEKYVWLYSNLLEDKNI
jgi:glycosyltransferase involved in cell wall biosynthesis